MTDQLTEQARYDQRIGLLISLSRVATFLQECTTCPNEIRREINYVGHTLISCFSDLSKLVGNPTRLETEAPNIESAITEVVCAQFEQLRAFAQGICRDWPDVYLDACDVQTLAEKHGLLKGTMMDKPCGEECWCAAEVGADEFPLMCFHKTSLLTGKVVGGKEDE